MGRFLATTPVDEFSEFLIYKTHDSLYTITPSTVAHHFPGLSLIDSTDEKEDCSER
jgi:hypothetical protein